MNNNIPQEIKDTSYPQHVLAAMKKYADDNSNSLWNKAAELDRAVLHGYSLALPEISALKAEVERLRGMVKGNNGPIHQDIDDMGNDPL